MQTQHRNVYFLSWRPLPCVSHLAIFRNLCSWSRQLIYVMGFHKILFDFTTWQKLTAMFWTLRKENSLTLTHSWLMTIEKTRSQIVTRFVIYSYLIPSMNTSLIYRWWERLLSTYRPYWISFNRRVKNRLNAPRRFHILI